VAESSVWVWPSTCGVTILKPVEVRRY
jgi:hypothetical protein